MSNAPEVTTRGALAALPALGTSTSSKLPARRSAESVVMVTVPESSGLAPQQQVSSSSAGLPSITITVLAGGSNVSS